MYYSFFLFFVFSPRSAKALSSAEDSRLSSRTDSSVRPVLERHDLSPTSVAATPNGGFQTFPDEKENRAPNAETGKIRFGRFPGELTSEDFERFRAGVRDKDGDYFKISIGTELESDRQLFYAYDSTSASIIGMSICVKNAGGPPAWAKTKFRANAELRGVNVRKPFRGRRIAGQLSRLCFEWLRDELMATKGQKATVRICNMAGQTGWRSYVRAAIAAGAESLTTWFMSSHEHMLLLLKSKPFLSRIVRVSCSDDKDPTTFLQEIWEMTMEKFDAIENGHQEIILQF